MVPDLHVGTWPSLTQRSSTTNSCNHRLHRREIPGGGVYAALSVADVRILLSKPRRISDVGPVLPPSADFGRRPVPAPLDF